MGKLAHSFGYEVSVLFLGEGPLVMAMKDAGIAASVVSWAANRRDLAGAWQVWRWLRQNPADVAHVHHGGLSVRAVCRMAGVKAIVQHVHGRILEPTGISVAHMDFRAVDAIIACSQAVADCLPGRDAEVIYAGVETGSRPPATQLSAGPLKLGVLARLIPLKNIESVIRAICPPHGHGDWSSGGDCRNRPIGMCASRSRCESWCGGSCALSRLAHGR